MGLTSDKTRNTSETSSESLPLLHHEEPYYRQYLAAFLASLISFSTGCVGGWSSPATPALQSGAPKSDLGLRPLTVDEASWVGSLINLGALFGSIPAGYLSFRWGRKWCLLTLAWPIIIGWLLILFNDNNVRSVSDWHTKRKRLKTKYCNQIWNLYIGRTISGISYGSLNVALPIYCNEISSNKIRGRLGIMYDFLQCVGLLWVYSFGAITSLFWVTVSCLIIPIIFLLTFIWMPESPLYLVRIGKEDEAIDSIRWLHGENCDVNKELIKIQHALLEGTDADRNVIKHNSDGFHVVRHIRNFYYSLSKVTIKAVLIAFFMFVLQRSCGATMVQYYADSIFALSYSSIPPNLATVLIGIISVISSIMSMLAVDTIGRRFLLVFSFIFMTLSMLVFVGYLILILNGSGSTNGETLKNYYGLIPAITLCLFVAMFRLGVSPLPWFMAPEIIPTEAQKWAPSMIVCITWGSSFLLSKCFLPAIDAFGQVTVYSFFLLVCAIGVGYTWAVIPETKNKSREEIQRELGAEPSCYEAI